MTNEQLAVLLHQIRTRISDKTREFRGLLNEASIEQEMRSAMLSPLEDLVYDLEQEIDKCLQGKNTAGRLHR
jgi:hypothetical protein